MPEPTPQTPEPMTLTEYRLDRLAGRVEALEQQLRELGLVPQESAPPRRLRAVD